MFFYVVTIFSSKGDTKSVSHLLFAHSSKKNYYLHNNRYVSLVQNERCTFFFFPEVLYQEPSPKIVLRTARLYKLISSGGWYF
jgi:hypothetical protein